MTDPLRRLAVWYLRPHTKRQHDRWEAQVRQALNRTWDGVLSSDA